MDDAPAAAPSPPVWRPRSSGGVSPAPSRVGDEGIVRDLAKLRLIAEDPALALVAALDRGVGRLRRRIAGTCCCRTRRRICSRRCGTA